MLSFLSIFNKFIISPLGKTTSKPKHRSLVLPYFKTFIPPAGGINVLKYGNTRDLCLGLEVVLPNGDIMNLLKILKKDNTGYDLKNIFIGAEGTLGIITAATMKLFPKPKLSITSFVETLSINNAIKLLNLFEQELKNELEAFGLMPKVFWEVASNNTENLSLPFNKILSLIHI